MVLEILQWSLLTVHLLCQKDLHRKSNRIFDFSTAMAKLLRDDKNPPQKIALVLKYMQNLNFITRISAYTVVANLQAYVYTCSIMLWHTPQ